MADTIGSLAYRVKFDARQLTQGLLSTRQQMSAARKMTESMQSPLERYINGLTNLSAIIKRNTDLEKHRVTMENQLERAYLEEAAAVRVLTREEMRRLEVLKLADRVRGGTGAAAAGGNRVDHAKIYREENRERGLAEQERVRRYTVAVDAETAAARKALHERLQLYKAEKAAREALNKTTVSNAANAFGSMYGSRNSRAGAFATTANAALAQGNANRISNVMNGVRPMDDTFKNSATFAKELTQASKAMDGLALGAKAFVGFKVAQTIANTTAAIGDFRRASVQMYADIESNTKIFEAFTGSAQMSQTIMNDLRKLAPEVGTSFSALQDSARTLMAAGVEGPNVVDRLREMSKITLGNTERLKTMSLAYSQAFNLQKLMGQERLQFSNAGFNPLVEISRTTGMGMPQLAKMMEEGKISIDMLTKSLQTATTGSGNFANVTELTADSTRRAMNQTSAAWEMAMTDVGEAMRPVTIGLSWISKSLAEDISNGTKAAASAFGMLAPKIEENAAAIAKREKAIAAESDRLKERARIQELLKSQEAQKKADRQFGLDAMVDLRKEQYKTDPTMNKNVVERAERIFSLLDGKTKEMAMGDFSEYRNMETLLSYLDKEVAAELKSTEAIIAKNKQLEIQKDLREQGDKITRKFGTSNFERDEALKQIEKERKKLARDSYKLMFDPEYFKYRDHPNHSRFQGPGGVASRAEAMDRKYLELNAREKAAREMSPTKLSESEMEFAQAIGNLQMLLANGAIGKDAFALERERLAKESMDFKPTQAANSIQAGSQEAYKQMIAGQLRGENKLLKEQQAMKLIAKTQLAAQQEQVRLQKELNEKMDFESVGAG